MKCKKCGAEAKEYREGHTRGWVCESCGWGYVTSYYEPYETDTTQYFIIVYGNEINTERIKAISKIAGVNSLRAKQLLEMPEATIFNGRTTDILEIRKILLNESISFKITPEFIY